MTSTETWTSKAHTHKLHNVNCPHIYNLFLHDQTEHGDYNVTHRKHVAVRKEDKKKKTDKQQDRTLYSQWQPPFFVALRACHATVNHITVIHCT